VVTRGASAGGGNLTLDFLYLSDGWLRNSSENRANNINTLEAYHEIRGNLKISSLACLCLQLFLMSFQEQFDYSIW
jgi:hypothetical protein